MSPGALSLGEFAMGVALRFGTRDWSVLLVTEASRCETVARQLADEIEAQVEVLPVIAEVAESLIEVLRHENRPVVVGYQGARALDAVWSSLDLDRSRLPAAQSVMLVLTPAAFDQLERRAPNLASWLGATVSLADLDAGLLTDDERAMMLEGFRTKFAMTDEELLKAAAEGRAPAEPEVATWLVLLGRGDLLGA